MSSFMMLRCGRPGHRTPLFDYGASLVNRHRVNLLGSRLDMPLISMHERESRMMARHRRARSSGPSRLAKLGRCRRGPGCRAAAWRGRADRTLRYEYEMVERRLHDRADA